MGFSSAVLFLSMRNQLVNLVFTWRREWARPRWMRPWTRALVISCYSLLTYLASAQINSINSARAAYSPFPLSPGGLFFIRGAGRNAKQWNPQAPFDYLIPDQFLFCSNFSRLLKKTELIDGAFGKWNIQVSPESTTTQPRVGSSSEFSAVIAALLVVSVGIGVVGIVSIVISCRKRKR